MAIKLSALFTCIFARFDREESKGCAGAIKDVAHVVGAKVVTLPQKGRSPNVSAAFREVMQKATAVLDYTPNARALVSQTNDTMVAVGHMGKPCLCASAKESTMKRGCAC